MAEDFKAIETQEELDKIIQERLGREREKLSKQYQDYDQIKKLNETLTKEKETFESTVKEKTDALTSLEAQLKEANSKAAGFEMANLKTEVAIAKGLPMELRGRLNGSTKEELEADADNLAGLFKQQNNRDLPGFEASGNDSGDSRADLKSMVDKLRKGE